MSIIYWKFVIRLFNFQTYQIFFNFFFVSEKPKIFQKKQIIFSLK